MKYETGDSDVKVVDPLNIVIHTYCLRVGLEVPGVKVPLADLDLWPD